MRAPKRNAEIAVEAIRSALAEIEEYGKAWPSSNAMENKAAADESNKARCWLRDELNAIAKEIP